jgi:hypothetical protein
VSRGKSARIRAALVAAGLTGAVVVGSLATGGIASAAPSPSPSTTATPKPTSSATPTPSPTATALPRPVGDALSIELTGAPVLTLPAADGLRDTTAVRVRSGAAGTVDVVAQRGKRSVLLAEDVRLAKKAGGWQRTIRIADTDLRAGRWSLVTRRSDDRSVRATAADRVAVGSGEPVHVTVVPVARTVYPWQDGALDRTDVTVTGTDETGTPIPLRGTVRLDAGGDRRTAALSAGGAAAIPVTDLALGAGVVTATVTGPAGDAVRRTTGLTLAPTGVGSLSLSRSSDTLQPVKDGFLDSLTLTTAGVAPAGSPAQVSGTLVLTRGATVVQRWIVPDGAQRTFTWDGRVGGVIVPGTYTATLTLVGQEGLARTKAKTVLVTKDHLPYVVQDLFSVAAGNQQGLAVHGGTFYVGFDNGDGTARIDRYNGGGALIGTWSPLAIGHVAELVYSTTTQLLYAANGGATNDTMVWALNPETGDIVDTFDLSTLGPNGMVAMDDANNRMLVFAGTKDGGYTVTPVTISDAADGSAAKHDQGPSMPITITGVPQGIELVGPPSASSTQLWVYTSLRGRNHLAKYDLPAPASLSSTATSSGDLMWGGEGEGSALDSWNGAPAFFIGAHDTNRIGTLVPVADE